jgi:hypothetical protein
MGTIRGLHDPIGQAGGGSMTVLLMPLRCLGIKGRLVTYMNRPFGKIHFPEIAPLFGNLMVSPGKSWWDVKVMATETKMVVGGTRASRAE